MSRHQYEAVPSQPDEQVDTRTSINPITALLPPHIQQFISANVGLLYVASSQIFFVGMGLVAKLFLSTTKISTLTLILVRMSITAAGCLAWLAYEGNEYIFLGPPEIRPLLCFRGIAGFGGLFSNYQSLRGLSLSDSVTIQFISPNLTALLGFLVLGEVLGWREISAGFICLGGVVLVSRPPFIFGHHEDTTHGDIPEEGDDAGIDHADRMAAVAWAMTAVCCSACAYITIRYIGKRAHAMHSMLYFCYGCVIPCFIGLLFQITHLVFVKTWKEFGLIMLIGIFGFMGQMLLTFGLQREKAGRATLASYLSLFYSLVFEFVLFHTIPPFLSILGATIIISAAVWVAINKQKEVKPEETLPFSTSPSPSPSPSPVPSKRVGQEYAYGSPSDRNTLLPTDSRSLSRRSSGLQSG